MQSYSSINITFTSETTRSTFRSVISEIRRVFGVRVAYFNNTDEFGAFHAMFEGPINSDHATSLYSRRLSKKARKYIESMEIYAITSPNTRIAAECMSSIDIMFTDETTRSTFADVMREITRKLGVQVTYSSFNDNLGHSAIFKGPISTDEIFLLYSRRLSKKALRSITLSSNTAGQPTTPIDVTSSLSQEGFDGAYDFGVSDPSKFLKLIQEMFELGGYRGFRIDAVPPPWLPTYRDPLPQSDTLRRQWPPQWLNTLKDDQQ